MHAQVDLLGQFRVAVNDRDVSVADWRRERSAALVKLLALSQGHRLHREQAMEALWPEMSPDASSANLRKAIYFARRALGEPELIALRNDIVALAPPARAAIRSLRPPAGRVPPLSPRLPS